MELDEKFVEIENELSKVQFIDVNIQIDVDKSGLDNVNRCIYSVQTSLLRANK